MTAGAIPSIELSALAPDAIPAALAELHAAHPLGTTLRVTLPRALSSTEAMHLAEGGGFTVQRARTTARGRQVVLERARTLPDWAAPGLRLLICGLNPSLYAADTGVPFGRPGNRLWPALLACGCVERPRDVRAALACGVGFTDLVKRATTSAAEVAASEYTTGFGRLLWLIGLVAPQVTCFVGLEGYRRARDPRAAPGWIAGGVGGRPAYLMPSSSGRNAHATPSDLARHIACAIA